MPPTQEDGLEVFFQKVAERLAPLLAPLLAQTMGHAPDKYADVKNHPCRSANEFRNLARAGAFPTFRRGGRTTALWVDVEKAIESRVRPPKPKAADPKDALRAELEQAGITLRRKPGRS